MAKARKGPDAHASATPVGTVAKGNDGRDWVVKATAAGVRRWVPKGPETFEECAAQFVRYERKRAGGVTQVLQGRRDKVGDPPPGYRRVGVRPAWLKATFCKPQPAGAPAKAKVAPGRRARRYLTLDNGGSAFLVVFDKDTYAVYEPHGDACVDAVHERDTWTDADVAKCFTSAVASGKHVRALVGADPNDKRNLGNSVMFELPGGVYLHVGETVFRFKPPERIARLVSPVGNSAVPYPYAVGKSASYLTLERVAVPHADKASPAQDPYEFAYDAPKAYAKAHPLPGYRLVRGRRF